MPTLRIAVAIVLGVAFMIGAVYACTGVLMTGLSSHQATLDRIPIPTTWTLVDGNVVRNPLLGSRIERYYAVDADPDQLVDPVRQVLQAGGFTLAPHYQPSDWCTFTKVGDVSPPWGTYQGPCPQVPLDPCSTNGQGGPMTCYLNATRGGDEIQVVAFDRDQPTAYFVGSESHEVRAPGKAIVRVIDSWH